MPFNTFDDKTPPLDLTKLDENFASLSGTGAGQGAAMVGSANNGTVAKALRAVVSADGFAGLDPTGVADSSGALNAALAAAFALGNCDVKIPPGTYRLNSPVVLAVPASPLKRHDMPTIVGGGQNDCILKPTFAGSAIKLRGIAPANGTGTQSGTYFFWGGGVSDLTIDGSLSPLSGAPFAGGATDGLELTGTWLPTIARCKFTRLRHGIAMPSDLAYNPNPDWSAPGKGLIDGCSFERIHGWGVYNPQVQGAPSWRVENCFFIFCGTGGILCSSSDWIIAGNGGGAFGWIDETLAGGSANGCFVEFAASTTGTSKIKVYNNEIDGSRKASFRCVRLGPSEFSTNRHVVRSQPYSGAVAGTAYPQAAFDIGPDSGADSVVGIDVHTEIVRLDADLGTGAAFTYARFVNNANMVDIAIKAPTVADNTAGSASFTLQTGATTSNLHLRQGFRFVGSPLTSKEQCSGKPLPFFHGTINGTPASPTAEAALNFDLPSTLTTQVYPGLYASSQWTAQATDLHEIVAKVAYVPTAAAQAHTIRVYIGGVLQDEVSDVSRGAHRHFLILPLRSYLVTKGQTIEVRMVSNVSAPITGAYSYLNIQQRSA